MNLAASTEPVETRTDTDTLRLAFAGGGTGGHILPGRHLLENLQARDAASLFVLEDLVWFGTGRAVEERSFQGLDELLGESSFERIALALEPAGGGAPSLSGLSLKLLPAIRHARRVLRQHRTQVVLGLGGFTTLPVVLAARSLGLPTALLEINAVPGKATRWLSPLATRVYHAWPATLPRGRGRGRRDVWTGPPLATRYQRGQPDPNVQGRARAELGFEAESPLLLVLGGSQGASGINDFLLRHAPLFAGEQVQIYHQAGPGKLDPELTEHPKVRSVEYIHDVATALEACDLVLCRGGASTLSELCGLGRPAVVVPYPHHADLHQAVNARQLGAGVRLVLEQQLSESTARELCRLLSPHGKATRDSMAAALRGRFPCESPGQRILEDLYRLATERTRKPLNSTAGTEATSPNRTAD